MTNLYIYDLRALVWKLRELRLYSYLAQIFPGKYGTTACLEILAA